jgi:DnaJ-class molecular chaperone
MPTCMRCGGKGSVTCPRCDGRGTEASEGQLELLADPVGNAPGCPECEGTGVLSCPVCGGTGDVDNED